MTVVSKGYDFNKIKIDILGFIVLCIIYININLYNLYIISLNYLTNRYYFSL